MVIHLIPQFLDLLRVAAHLVLQPLDLLVVCVDVVAVLVTIQANPPCHSVPVSKLRIFPTPCLALELRRDHTR
eukprot:11211698-Heterocapsa_arctica.AAC.1